MNIGDTIKRVQNVVGENSTAILTAAGITGTVTTAVLTGRASYKAGFIIQEAAQQDISAGPVTTREKIDLTWKLYIPAVTVGSTTIATIFFANRIGSKKTAAMAAAYGLSDRAFAEYKEKVRERLGLNKEEKLRDEIAQDRVNRNPVGDKIVIMGTGDILCYDASTGRYFMSTHETIQKAENKVNREIINHMSCSLSTFYDLIGLSPTSYSDEVGWNNDNYIEVHYTTTLSSDGRPCLVIDFSVAPIRNFATLY